VHEQADEDDHLDHARQAKVKEHDREGDEEEDFHVQDEEKEDVRIVLDLDGAPAGALGDLPRLVRRELAPVGVTRKLERRSVMKMRSRLTPARMSTGR
jgi:hypothetical protein